MTHASWRWWNTVHWHRHRAHVQMLHSHKDSKLQWHKFRRWVMLESTHKVQWKWTYYPLVLQTTQVAIRKSKSPLLNTDMHKLPRMQCITHHTQWVISSSVLKPGVGVVRTPTPARTPNLKWGWCWGWPRKIWRISGSLCRGWCWISSAKPRLAVGVDDSHVILPFTDTSP